MCSDHGVTCNKRTHVTTTGMPQAHVFWPQQCHRHMCVWTTAVPGACVCWPDSTTSTHVFWLQYHHEHTCASHSKYHKRTRVLATQAHTCTYRYLPDPTMSTRMSGRWYHQHTCVVTTVVQGPHVCSPQATRGTHVFWPQEHTRIDHSGPMTTRVLATAAPQAHACWLQHDQEHMRVGQVAP